MACPRASVTTATRCSPTNSTATALRWTADRPRAASRWAASSTRFGSSVSSSWVARCSSWRSTSVWSATVPMRPWTSPCSPGDRRQAAAHGPHDADGGRRCGSRRRGPRPWRRRGGRRSRPARGRRGGAPSASGRASPVTWSPESAPAGAGSRRSTRRSWSSRNTPIGRWSASCRKGASAWASMRARARSLASVRSTAAPMASLGHRGTSFMLVAPLGFSARGLTVRPVGVGGRDGRCVPGTGTSSGEEILAPRTTERGDAR